MICCAESTLKPGTSAKCSTASWCRLSSGQLLVELADLLVDELQLLQEHLQQPAVDWFELCASAFSPRLASKTVRNMHGCLRAVLNQGKAWELVRTNPAQGVRLPRKKARK
jgi:hypothetical protein